MLNTIIIESNKSGRENLSQPDIRKPDASQTQEMLRNHFANSDFGKTKQISTIKKRTRLVVKKGVENIPFPLEDIALFYTENKIVYVIDRHGMKYIAESNLSELEQQLDDSVFFRANRQYVINLNHVKSFRTYEKVKLKIDMKPEGLNDRYHIIISQDTAPAFREWIYAV